MAKINGVALGTTTASSGAFLLANGSTWVGQTLTQDLSVTGNGTATVSGLNGSPLATYFASPPAIGGTAPAAVTGTTITGTTLASTVATGTAPFTVASTTAVANLNASLLLGNTWAAPGAIGGTTAAAGAFTTGTFTGTCGPSVDNTYNLGSGSVHWLTCFLTGNFNASGASSSVILGNSSSTGAPLMSINTAAGHARLYEVLGAGNLRWTWGADSSAESGSNAGSAYVLNAAADNGSAIDTPVSITRASGGTISLGGTSNRPLLTTGSVQIDTAGQGLQIKTGSNAKMGTGTLSTGTVVISTTAVKSGSFIFLTDTSSGIVNLGALTVSSISDSVSFTVKSSNAADTSTFNWLIVDPAP